MLNGCGCQQHLWPLRECAPQSYCAFVYVSCVAHCALVSQELKDVIADGPHHAFATTLSLHLWLAHTCGAASELNTSVACSGPTPSCPTTCPSSPPTRLSYGRMLWWALSQVRRRKPPLYSCASRRALQIFWLVYTIMGMPTYLCRSQQFHPDPAGSAVHLLAEKQEGVACSEPRREVHLVPRVHHG